MKARHGFALFFTMLIVISGFSQSVKGHLVLSSGREKDFIVRNTKVVLVTKKSRDTAFVNEDLTFNFPTAASGTGYLYLVSPTLPSYTEYKFRIRKKKPTHVGLQYDKFKNSPTRPAKTPEEREAELQAGFFIARLALDLLYIFHR